MSSAELTRYRRAQMELGRAIITLAKEAPMDDARALALVAAGALKRAIAPYTIVSCLY
jgi:hypothetical protein